MKGVLIVLAALAACLLIGGAIIGSPPEPTATPMVPWREHPATPAAAPTRHTILRLDNVTDVQVADDPIVHVQTREFLHQHEWVKGPFYITAYELVGLEDSEKPPIWLITSGTPAHSCRAVQLEHCKLCGQLRLPGELWGETGAGLGAKKP